MEDDGMFIPLVEYVSLFECNKDRLGRSDADASAEKEHQFAHPVDFQEALSVR